MNIFKRRRKPTQILSWPDRNQSASPIFDAADERHAERFQAELEDDERIAAWLRGER